MNRTITTFYEFCYLTFVNKKIICQTFQNIQILNYFKSYSKEDIIKLNEQLLFKQTPLAISDFGVINIWELINRRNIKAVSCCYKLDYEYFYGLCYRCDNKIYNQHYYFAYDFNDLARKRLKEAKIKKFVNVTNIEDFKFLSNLREDFNL